MRLRDVARAALFAALLTGCHRTKLPAAFLVVEAKAASELDLGTATVRGSGVKSVVLSSGKLFIEREPGEKRALAVAVKGACTLHVAPSELASGATTRRVLSPQLSFKGGGPELGFGTRFRVVVEPGCEETRTVRVEWTETAGRPLDDLRVEQQGHELSATLPSADALLDRVPRWGVVPVAERTRGEVELRAAWTYRGEHLTRVVRVAAAARSHGLPNVAVATRLYLAGDGFRVTTAPGGSHAVVEAASALTAFTPDAAGEYTLTDAHGKTLHLYAGRYEDTPLDCGRSDCHAEIAASARSNPMTTVLQRGLDGPFAGDYPACALACHAVGEPGTDDGGFVAVAARLGLSSADLRRSGYHDLPSPLRRLGGVGCLGCHGPGSVAAPGGRDALLRTDVCATCHDAPPTYGHVVAWRRTRLSRSDADARTREGTCARCHTTWGFLGEDARKPESYAEPVGITCAACHAVHPAERRAESVIGATCAAALRRETTLPAILDGAISSSSDRSRACLSCHVPADGDRVPAASAAVLWAGRGGLEPATGAPLDGPSPHGAVDGGCIGCHRSGPGGLGRGASHAFEARAGDCTPCHEDRRDPSIRERALALWALADPTSAVAGSDPPHAAPKNLDKKTPRGRALWDVALVLEDGAADRHNAPYARALIDAAERALGGRP